MKIGKAGAKLFKQVGKRLANTSVGKKLYKGFQNSKLGQMYRANPEKFGRLVGASIVTFSLVGAAEISDIRNRKKEKANISQMQNDIKALQQEVARMKKEQEVVKNQGDNSYDKQPAAPVQYQSPIVGENGIAAVDTTAYYGRDYYSGNRKPAEITYYSDAEKKNPVYREDFNQDGSLEDYTRLYPSERKGFYDEVTYSPSNENVGSFTNYKDGSTEHSWKGKDGWNTVIRDKNDRPLKEEYSGDRYPKYYTYLSNGNHTEEERDDYNDRTISFVEKDKQDRVVKQKHFKDGVLDYTVFPRRDSDGSVIKNDTVYNKKAS